MSKADDGLRRIVQDYLPKPMWLWTPIESGGTHQGVPDSHWAHPASQTSGWIEHKATDGWAVTVRPHQIAWMSRHAAAGVRVHVLVRARGVGSAAGRGDALWVLAGRCVGRLAEGGLEGLDHGDVLLRCAGRPAQWDWPALGNILTLRQS